MSFTPWDLTQNTFLGTTTTTSHRKKGGKDQEDIGHRGKAVGYSAIDQ